MLTILVYLLIGCLILYLAWWALSQIPLPQPVRVVVVVIAAIVGILFLLQLVPLGHLALR